MDPGGRNDNNRHSRVPVAVVKQAADRMHSAISGLLLVWAALFVIACQTVDDGRAQTVAYRSVWNQLYPASLKQSPDADSLQSRFIHAASAQTLDVAIKRWSSFLGEWRPQNGQFENGMQARLVSWAELEMQRTRHLETGNLTAAREVEAELLKFSSQME